MEDSSIGLNDRLDQIDEVLRRVIENLETNSASFTQGMSTLKENMRAVEVQSKALGSALQAEVGRRDVGIAQILQVVNAIDVKSTTTSTLLGNLQKNELDSLNKQMIMDSLLIYFYDWTAGSRNRNS